MRLILSFLGLSVVALGVLTACNSAEWRTARTSPVAPAPANATPASDGARRITIPQLKEMLDRNEVLVIDVRNEASYNVGHIKGARLIPEAEVVNHINEFPKNKLIVTYCS